MEQQLLTTSMTTYTVSNEETGERLAGFELTWSNGIQEELSEPAAVLLDKPADTISIVTRN